MKVAIVVLLSFVSIVGCISVNKDDTARKVEYPSVKIVSAMKNAVWKGELYSKIDLDTISDKTGLYGLGPVTYMKGEIMINNGEIWVSRVAGDSCSVRIEDQVSAPFFVYTNVTLWDTMDLPKDVHSISDLEDYLLEKTKPNKLPYAFKLIGKIEKAITHIQNLPEGATVSNPSEAHTGQEKYNLKNTEVEIVGFFSTKHQGVFTHHDSYLHMHLITDDKSNMGHLDEVSFGKMQLMLPGK